MYFCIVFDTFPFSFLDWRNLDFWRPLLCLACFRSLKNRVFSIFFYLFSASIFGRILIDFRCLLAPFWDPLGIVFRYFFGIDFLMIFGACFLRFWIENVVPGKDPGPHFFDTFSDLGFGIDFFGIFYAFWIHFGAVFDQCWLHFLTFWHNSSILSGFRYFSHFFCY